MYEPATVTKGPPSPPNRNGQSVDDIRRKGRALRRHLPTSTTTISVQDNLKNPPREMSNVQFINTNSSAPVEPKDPLSAADVDHVREPKWTGEAEEASTIARRKAIQEIMKDTSLSAAERNQKIQLLMSGKVVLNPSPVDKGGLPLTESAPPLMGSTLTGENEHGMAIAKRKSIDAVTVGSGSVALNSTEQTRRSVDAKPGFTPVKGIDSRAAMKTRHEMVPMSVGEQGMGSSKTHFSSESKVGFTAVRGEDSMVLGKMSRATAPISTGISQFQPSEPSKENRSDDVRPGVTAVRGEDARISRKVTRGSFTVALPLDLLAPPQLDDAEPMRPDAAGLMGRSDASDPLLDADNSHSFSSMPGASRMRGRDSLVSRKVQSSLMGPPVASLKLDDSSSSSTPGASPMWGHDTRVSRKVQSSMIVAAVASLKLDDSESDEKPASKPGAVGAYSDSRVARKIGVATKANTSNSATTFDSCNVSMDEPGAIVPGAVTSMANDSRVARKMQSNANRGPGVFQSTDDSQVRRKVSISRRSASISDGRAVEQADTFEDEPESLVLPGRAVASRNDSRLSRKLAQGNTGVGAQSASDDTAVSKKVGRTRGAAMGLLAATAAANIGAVRTFGDDEAAQKKSFVQDELFATDDGNEINPDDYLLQQVRATQEAQQKKKAKKKDKDQDEGLHKDGDAAVPKLPGAFSVKGGRGWFTGGFRQRAARGMVRNRNQLILDADVTAVVEDDFDEDETWWDRADKPTLIVGACVLVFAIIVISVPVGLAATKVDPPTPAPTSPRFFALDDFKELLAPVTDPAVFEDPQSPQSRALNWIVYDDELELSPSDTATIQRYICMVMYFSNGGENWDFPQPAVEWGSGVHECEWDYITCESNMTVGKLNLLQRGLTGSLEAEMVHLSQLTSLDLGRNKMSIGSFPELLFQMTKLRFLYLDSVGLEGTIPSEIAKLNKLEQLYLSANSFSGSLPSEMQALTSMESFQTNTNNLEGDIFNIVGGWPVLKNLDFGNNDFVGTIPTNLPSSLVSLRLDRNSVGGSLPTELGTLTNLKSVIVTQNFRLGGALPSELGRCSSLETLQIDSNTFSGKIPSEFGNLPAILEIRLGQNDFTGRIPSELGLCTTLTKLDLNNNNFINAVPTELGKLTALSLLWLQFSNLSGSMPSEICSLRQAKLVDVQADCKFSNSGLKCDEPECCTLCH